VGTGKPSLLIPSLTDIAAFIAFMACVALASYAQNLTGFAFSLILLGLVSVLHIASITDTANAAMVLTLVSAWTYFRTQRAPPPWALVRPAMLGSALGVAGGVTLLGWLSGSSLVLLRALLGVCVLGCAWLLVARGDQGAVPIKPSQFAAVGVLAGLLGGLFSTSGPPLVYYLYRQSLDRETVRRALLVLFAFGALVRLVLVLPTGQFSLRAAVLAACAVPVVYGVTRWHHHLQPRLAVATLQRVVAGLLALTGVLLLVDACRQMG